MSLNGITFGNRTQAAPQVRANRNSVGFAGKGNAADEVLTDLSKDPQINDFMERYTKGILRLEENDMKQFAKSLKKKGISGKERIENAILAYDKTNSSRGIPLDVQA